MQNHLQLGKIIWPKAFKQDQQKKGTIIILLNTVKKNKVGILHRLLNACYNQQTFGFTVCDELYYHVKFISSTYILA